MLEAEQEGRGLEESPRLKDVGILALDDDHLVLRDISRSRVDDRSGRDSDFGRYVSADDGGG